MIISNEKILLIQNFKFALQQTEDLMPSLEQIIDFILARSGGLFRENLLKFSYSVLRRW